MLHRATIQNCTANGMMNVVHGREEGPRKIFTRTGSLIPEKSLSNVAIFLIACSLQVATMSASLGRSE